MKRSIPLFAVCLCFAVFPLSCAATAREKAAIQVVLLGTGTPYPDPQQFGSAILVEAEGDRLLFDCGRGAVVRLKQAGIPLQSVDAVFLTHLHSDHTVGIPDLWLTGWFLGRKHPLKIWGPAGTQEFAQGLSRAFHFDIETREAPPESLPAAGAQIDAEEVRQGVVYQHGPLRVTAFVVDHGQVKPAFGYRIDDVGHSVVISGDTRFSPNLIRFARGADCLIHAAWQANARNPTPADQRSIASADDAGRVFAIVKPKLAIVTHYQDPIGMAEEVHARYKGPFVMARDLMTVEIGSNVSWHFRESAGH
jgi:ribonuclease Z